MREEPVEGQIQWILSYVQGGVADMQKENIIEELESGKLEYESAEEFLTSLKKEFGEEEEESVKAAELRKLEQGGRMMEEFVQEFKRAARGSGYKERPLVEEFKREMNGAIRRKLMEAKNQPGSIEQWFRRVMALNRNWRESRREEERTGRRSSKARAKANIATTITVAEEANAPQQTIIGPAPMEGVERTNVVVIRGWGLLLGGIPMQWKSIEKEIVMPVEDLGIWPTIVGIGNREKE